VGKVTLWVDDAWVVIAWCLGMLIFITGKVSMVNPYNLLLLQLHVQLLLFLYVTKQHTHLLEPPYKTCFVARMELTFSKLL